MAPIPGDHDESAGGKHLERPPRRQVPPVDTANPQRPTWAEVSAVSPEMGRIANVSGPAHGRRNACDDARPGWGTPASVHGEVGKATNSQGRYPMGVANMDKEEEIDVAGGRLKTRDRITRIEFLLTKFN